MIPTNTILGKMPLHHLCVWVAFIVAQVLPPLQAPTLPQEASLDSCPGIASWMCSYLSLVQPGNSSQCRVVNTDFWFKHHTDWEQEVNIQLRRLQIFMYNSVLWKHLRIVAEAWVKWLFLEVTVKIKWGKNSCCKLTGTKGNRKRVRDTFSQEIG